MEFMKDLEFQRLYIFTVAQLEMENMKQAKHNVQVVFLNDFFFIVSNDNV